ncbi:MAG: hypothetical protein LBB72_08665 [Spirochaetaceae bacterium]|jgi:hypothetical protein|nr:hypothetical protein [Spirochaetaceae bacterium]
MKNLVKKNMILFVFLALTANHTVFSQSVSIDTADIFNYANFPDYGNNGIIAYSNSGGYTDDYTKQDRITMGVLNMFFGLGSLLRGHKSGWLIMGLETAGVIFLYGGLSPSKETKTESGYDYFTGKHYTTTKEVNKSPEAQKVAVLIGSGLVGGTIILGYLIPYLYHKPGASKVSENNFPLDIGLAAARDGTVNGVRICYTIEY